MSSELAEATSLSLPVGPAVLVPVGSIEQHGPHLPLDTDTVIATAAARRAATLLGHRLGGREVLVAPAVCYGASGEHQTFSGTSSIGIEALRFLLVELGRSMSTWAARIVFVNGHGGNLTALEKAARLLQAEGRDARWLPCESERIDLHAGRAETSLMLYLSPRTVDLDRAEPGNTAPLRDLLPQMLADGVAAVSANGVLGDPTGASAAEGERLLEQIARRLVKRMTAVAADVDPVAGPA